MSRKPDIIITTDKNKDKKVENKPKKIKKHKAKNLMSSEEIQLYILKRQGRK